MDKLNAASSNIKYIWIYYDDNTRGTIEVNKTSTATEVTEIIIKNKRLESSDNILVKILEKENGEFKVFQFSQEESVYETFDNFFNSVFEPGYKSGKIYWRDPTVPFEFKTHLTKEKKILVIPSSDKDLSIEKPIRTGTVSKKSKKTVDFKERELILYVKNELPQNNFLIYKKINDHKYKKLILNNAEQENQCQLDTYSNSVKTPYTFRFKSVEDYQKWVILLQAAIKESTKNEFLIAAQYDIERKELEQSNQDEKQLLSVSAGLKGLLKHKSSLEYLTRKLRAVHCEENIYFWLAVEEYKNIWRTSGISNMKKWEKAEEVFNNFLKRGDCPYEILVLPEQSEPVEKLIREQHDNFSASSSPPLDLYDELQEKIFSDIETVKEIKLNKGHYKRFVDCDDYSKISLGIPAMKPREIASSNLKKQKKFGFF